MIEEVILHQLVWDGSNKQQALCPELSLQPLFIGSEGQGAGISGIWRGTLRGSGSRFVSLLSAAFSRNRVSRMKNTTAGWHLASWRSSET